jgi:hypothetical protein
MTGCFVGSAVMLLLCTLITFLLPTEESLSEVREQPASTEQSRSGLKSDLVS